jgi:protein involved in polysaccharide export with SLBB domain
LAGDGQPPPQPPKTERERVEQDLKAAKKRVADLEAQRKDLDDAEAAAPRLVVTVYGGTPTRYEVTESVDGGKVIGSFETTSVELLTRFVRRTGADATGPKAVHVLASNRSPATAVKAVFDAVRGAGFPGATVRMFDEHEVPANPLTPDPRQVWGHPAADPAPVVGTFHSISRIEHADGSAQRTIVILPRGAEKDPVKTYRHYPLPYTATLFQEGTGLGLAWDTLKAGQTVILYRGKDAAGNPGPVERVGVTAPTPTDPDDREDPPPAAPAKPAPAAPAKKVVGPFRGVQAFKAADGTTRQAVVVADPEYGGANCMYPLAAGAYAFWEGRPGFPRLEWAELTIGQTVHVYVGPEPASNPEVLWVGVPEAAPAERDRVIGFFQGVEPDPVVRDYPFPTRGERRGLLISDKKEGGTHSHYELAATVTVFREGTGEKLALKDLKVGQLVHLYRAAGPAANPPVVRIGVPAAKAAYVIEPPDVLIVEAGARGTDAKGNAVTWPLPHQPVTGQYIVRPDGTIGLGVWGAVSVTGLTPDQAAAEVRKHVAGRPLAKDGDVTADNLVVTVAVTGANSKRYYVVVDRGAGEQVTAFPCTGTETVLDVLDALGQISDAVDVAACRVWVRRKGVAGKPDETLPVDWAGIKQGVTATNYQLLPGDRVYVKRTTPPVPPAAGGRP